MTTTPDSIAVEQFGRRNLLVRLPGGHGTAPVVAIAYCMRRSGYTGWYTVWDVARAGYGPVATDVHDSRVRAVLRSIAIETRNRLAGTRPTARTLAEIRKYAIVDESSR